MKTDPGGRCESRAGVRDLPDAPCYVVLCLDAEDVDKWYVHLETGFAAGNMLLQGSALGMGCWFTMELSGDERVEMRKAVDVPIGVVQMRYV